MLAISMVSLFLSLFFASRFVMGGSINVTYDDSDTSFFTWAGNWTAISPSNPCPMCGAQPNPSQTYGNTWHNGDTSKDVAGFCFFNGSAIYIYGIDDNTSNITFVLDGDLNTTSVHTYATGGYVYNALYFGASSLSPGSHILTWTLANNVIGGTAGLFDYAVVTMVDPSTTLSSDGTSAQAKISSAPTSASSTNGGNSTSHSSNTGTVVGAAVGGVIGLVALIVVGYFVHRRQLNERSGNTVRFIDDDGWNLPGPQVTHIARSMGHSPSNSTPVTYTTTLNPYSINNESGSPTSRTNNEQVLEKQVRELEALFASLHCTVGSERTIHSTNKSGLSTVRNVNFSTPPY